MRRVFLFIQLWFTLIATGFYSLWDLGNCIPIMHSSSLHVLSLVIATFSQCHQISIYDKDLLHWIWLPCCQASYWNLGFRRSNEWRVQCLFDYWVFLLLFLFFMWSIDCIWTCFSIVNVSEGNWMIMRSSKFFCFKIVFKSLIFLFFSFCLSSPLTSILKICVRLPHSVNL